MVRSFLASEEVAVLTSVYSSFRRDREGTSEPPGWRSSALGVWDCLRDLLMMTGLTGLAFQACLSEPWNPLACVGAWYIWYQAENQVIEACTCCL